MDISVVIVTRNTCSQTLEAIASVFASKDAFSKEVIVVDNGSTDDTPRLVLEKYPAVNYHNAGRNLGFACANNRGARDASGEFLLLLNSDAKLKPDSLEKSVTWMRAHPDCGIAGVQLLNADGSLQNSIANFPSLATELLNKSLLRRLFPKRFPGKEQRFTEPVEVETVVGAFLLTRKKIWDALGGLDERYFFFLEETDFCLQVKRSGSRVLHLPHITVWHGQGQTARKTHIPARVEYWRSRYAYFKKNHGTGTLLVLRVGLLFRLFVNVLANGLATFFTLGRAEKCRHKLHEQFALLRWHLQGCPANLGLPR